MTTLSDKTEKWITAALITGFALLALGFSLGPMFEGQDEDEHYEYVHYLANQRQLPDRLEKVHWEFSQPPLYYVFGVPIIWAVGDADLAQIRDRTNPYREIQIDASPDNTSKNRIVHEADEDFPNRGSQTALASHLIRLISVALGVGTLLACAAIFRELWPDRPDRRLMATGLAAFWPIAGWHFGMITNDHAATFTATLALLIMLRQARLGPSWGRAALLGVVVGAGLISKSSAQFLAIPLVVMAVIDVRRGWRYALLTAGVIILIAGWWYARNIIVYHDLLGTRAHLSALPWDEYIAADHTLLENLGQVFRIFVIGWANYGSEVDITPPPVILAIPAALAAAALGGLIFRGRSQLPEDPARRRLVIVYLSFAIAVTAAILYYPLISTLGFQGRFLLLAIAVFPAVLALGISAWPPARLRLPAALGLSALLAVIASIGLFGAYLPAFRPGPPPGRIEHPLDIVYGDTLALVGVGQPSIEALPGETIGFTLYWRALKTTPDDLALDLYTTGFTLFHRRNFPGGGTLRSTSWKAGQTWSESYQITVPADAKPGVYRAIVIVFNRDTSALLPTTSTRGGPAQQNYFAEITVRDTP